jgi:hypothetical protein
MNIPLVILAASVMVVAFGYLLGAASDCMAPPPLWTAIPAALIACALLALGAWLYLAGKHP